MYMRAAARAHKVVCQGPNSHSNYITFSITLSKIEFPFREEVN